jgi:hypothetical protein
MNPSDQNLNVAQKARAQKHLLFAHILAISYIKNCAIQYRWLQIIAVKRLLPDETAPAERKFSARELSRCLLSEMERIL